MTTTLRGEERLGDGGGSEVKDREVREEYEVEQHAGKFEYDCARTGKRSAWKRGSQRPVVVSAAGGYSEATLLPLLSSLYQTGYMCGGGDVVLFRQAEDKPLDAKYARAGVREVVLRFEYPYLEGVTGEESWYPASREDMLHKFTPSDHFSTIRLLAMWVWLSSPDGQQYTHLLSIDARDALFQVNPFQAFYVGERFVVATEPRAFATCPVHDSWFRGMSTEGWNFADFKRAHGHKPILNSGVMIAHRSKMLEYLSTVISYPWTHAAHLSGFDQTILIFTMYHLEWEKRPDVVIIPYGVHFVNSEHYGRKDYTVIDDVAYFCNEYPVPIIHQYDRVENVLEWARKLYHTFPLPRTPS